MMRSLIVIAAFALAGSAIAVRAVEQAPRTARDKVYSEAQAARGGAQYAKLCAACHDPAKLVAGKEKGPELTGTRFFDEWQGRPLGALMETILLTMPNDGSAELTEEQTADLAAHILKINGYPAGAAPLTYAAGKDVVITK
jgi:mono/diheme cytochrome c family protein